MPTKITLSILVLIAFSVVVVFDFRRSSTRRAQDDIYSQLKALPTFSKDFSTPEGAILCLEDAYRRRDIDAAVAAKDFKTEARLMLLKTGFKDQVTDEIVAELAKTLELAFRAETTGKWPDFAGLEPFFTKRELHSENVVVVTEVCRFSDHGFSTQRLLVSKTTEGWRVLHLASK